MGVAAVKDTVASVSPWTSQIVIQNNTANSVAVFVARDASHPCATNAVEHDVPAQTIHPISSGWISEPRVTLLIRTGVHEAKLIRAPHASRISIDVEPHGLHVESQDRDVEIEAFADPTSLRGFDTLPMLMRGESFNSEEGRLERPGSKDSTSSRDPHPHLHAVEHALEDAAAQVSPWHSHIVVVNNTMSVVRVFLARNSAKPCAMNAVEHDVPANTTYSVEWGYVHDSRGTLLIRTGLHSAKIVRAPIASRILIGVEPHGLHVESQDHDVSIENYQYPESVPGFDTVPMKLRGESFDAEDGSKPKHSFSSEVSDEHPHTTARSSGEKLSPRDTQAAVKNTTDGPVKVLMPRDPAEPSSKNAIEQEVPANTTALISSGWHSEGKQTLLIAVGGLGMKRVRAGDGAQIVISKGGDGLSVESKDSAAEISDFTEAVASQMYEKPV